jgi:predicted MPP superfamily phosphohydrolase
LTLPPFLRKRLRVYAALLVIFGPLALWGFWIEPTRLVVNRTELALPGLPAELAGLRVAALSDLHVGGWHITEDRLREVVRRTNAESPDVIVLLGDFVQGARGRFVEPEIIAGILRELRAPLGVHAVLGNHDWWWNGRRVWKALEDQGIRVHEDTAVELRHRGAPLWLAGIPDFMTQEPDPAMALRKIPAGAPVIALTHGPDIFPRVPARVMLTLAGHTHGGQVKLPFVGALIVPSRYGGRYAAGHIVEEGRHLFVTTGIGTSILPVRLGVPPEIAILTLRRP